MKNKVYMAVSVDKYELPIAIFNDIYEMCSWAGRTKKAMWSALTRQQIDRKFNCRYISVNLEKEND